MASLATHNYMYVNAHTDVARFDALGSGNSSFKLKHIERFETLSVATGCVVRWYKKANFQSHK